MKCFGRQTRWQKVNFKYERENEVKASHRAVLLSTTAQRYENH